MRSIFLDEEIEIDGVLYAINAQAWVVVREEVHNEPGAYWGTRFDHTITERVPETVEILKMDLMQHNAATDCFDIEVLEPRIKEKAEQIAKQFAKERV